MKKIFILSLLLNFFTACVSKTMKPKPVVPAYPNIKPQVWGSMHIYQA